METGQLLPSRLARGTRAAGGVGSAQSRPWLRVGKSAGGGCRVPGDLGGSVLRHALHLAVVTFPLAPLCPECRVLVTLVIP